MIHDSREASLFLQFLTLSTPQTACKSGWCIPDTAHHFMPPMGSHPSFSYLAMVQIQSGSRSTLAQRHSATVEGLWSVQQPTYICLWLRCSVSTRPPLVQKWKRRSLTVSPQADGSRIQPSRSVPLTPQKSRLAIELRPPKMVMFVIKLATDPAHGRARNRGSSVSFNLEAPATM